MRRAPGRRPARSADGDERLGVHVGAGAVREQDRAVGAAFGASVLALEAVAGCRARHGITLPARDGGGTPRCVRARRRSSPSAATRGLRPRRAGTRPSRPAARIASTSTSACAGGTTLSSPPCSTSIGTAIFGGMRDRRVLAVARAASAGSTPDDAVEVARLETVRRRREFEQVGDAEQADTGAHEVAVERAQQQHRQPTRAAADDRDALRVAPAFSARVTDPGRDVGDVALAPPPSERLRVLAPVPSRLPR